MNVNEVLINGTNLFSLTPARVGGKFTWTSVKALTIGVAGEDTIFSDDTGVLIMSFNGTLSCDITVTGPGGLQTASSEVSDIWYGVYIIGDTTFSNTPKILLIPNGTAFSESGYDVKKRVAWVKNNGSGDFVHTVQTGTGIDRTYFLLSSTSNRKPLINGQETTPTTVNCNDFIPPSVTHAFFSIQFEVGSSGAAGDAGKLYHPDSSNALFIIKSGVISTEKYTMEAQCPVDSNQDIQYDVTQGGNNRNRMDLFVTGYVDNL